MKHIKHENEEYKKWWHVKIKNKIEIWKWNKAE